MTDKADQRKGLFESTISPLGLNPLCSRRQFLKLGGVTVVGLSALAPLLARGAAQPLIIMEQAQGLVVADPGKCVGCRRCELACTEFNDGKAQPALSKIKVNRNLHFGPKGVLAGRQAQGNWGNGLVVQDLCKQCPHPVPCANVCPNDAIVVAKPVNARVVDPGRCTGCKMCLRACPWEMISFDEDAGKASKCFLCHGRPKCVEACPAEALSYVAWRDLTDKIPHRVATTVGIPAEKAAACLQCHK